MLPPLNPHEFNYKEYLSKKGIYQQFFTSQNDFKLLKQQSFSLVGLSPKIRNTIQQALKKHYFSSDEFSVINALLLGQRQEISNELKNSYINAGVIHILAISGLHIGILLAIFSWLLKPLEKLKNGLLLKTLLLVFLLWSFAFIAGLSASVVRAVTMFSFVAIGLSFKKKRIIEHSLIASMFLLLLVKPLFLFDVGFQLSYLAVFGIVWIQPLLYQLFKPKMKVLNFLWNLTTVSVAAQIGILPISLYYFNQFPSLFLLSNLVIIPIIGGILSGGILVASLAVLGILPQFLADFYGFIISLLNSFVRFVSKQEDFLFKQISMSFLVMICCYACIVFAYQFFIRRKPKQLIYFLSSVVLLQSVALFEKQQRNSKQEFIVFHKNKNSIFGNRFGTSLKLFSNLDSIAISQQKLIQNYTLNEQTTVKLASKKVNIHQFKNENILVIDSLGVYDISIKNPIIVLQQSPKVNLFRVIEKLNPKKIIADGSNFKSYINRWKNTCTQTKTQFYHTRQNGAFILLND